MRTVRGKIEKRKKQKLKSAWFYDIESNMTVEYRSYEPGMNNNGDYHHTSFYGPFKTARGAWIKGRRQLVAEIEIARRNLASLDKSYYTIKEKQK